jgi:hypothetical protein
MIVLKNKCKSMPKLYLLFLIFISGIHFAMAQNEYGLLFISDIDARDEQEQTVGVHQIQFDNDMLSFYPNSYYTPIQAREDFFYVSPNLTTRTINFIFNSDHRGCFISNNPVFNIDSANNSNNGSEVYFLGCFASTVPYLIHLFPPTNTNTCVEQTIEFNNGWNWQYSYDGINWIDFSGEYQYQRSISFKIKDLTGYANKSKIYFRTGYINKFTNTVIYDIIPCSPNLVGIPETVQPSCYQGNDGQVTFTFDRNLINDEHFLLNLTQVVNGNNLPPIQKDISEAEFINKKITFTDLGSGSFFFHYQTFQNNNATPTSDNLSDPFNIEQPQALKFIISPTNPSCYGANGQILIEASGGTPPYYYSVNNNTRVQFTNPFTSDANGFKGSETLPIPNGIYSIKITDTKGCTEK